MLACQSLDGFLNMHLRTELIVENKFHSAILANHKGLATRQQTEQVLGYTIHAANGVALVRQKGVREVQL